MSGPAITRRGFNRWLAGGLLATGLRAHAREEGSAAKSAMPARLRVAAIQMAPTLGDLHSNLDQAERLARRALADGAQWVILPEMFTTAAAFHPDLLAAIQPVDGAPARLLRELARTGNATVGGSFLAAREGHVYNTFLLAFPDGSTVRHDKDRPTYWENCFYRAGDDDGVLATPQGPVGAALCWEFIRSQTARRLAGRVRMVVGGSCWWTLPDDADAGSPLHAANRRMQQQTPPRFARMLGVPVIHGAHAGPFEAFYSPDLPDVAYNSSYLGEAMIVSATGEVLARRARDAGAGIVVADVELPRVPTPTEAIPERFWIPEEMPQEWKDSWERWLARGAHYYETVTLPYLATGEINEYVPEYM